MVTLDQIREPGAAHLYPRHALVGCTDALVLFAAAWHGKQDAIWIADAGLTATCVDVDWARLEQMQRAYPAGWEFVDSEAVAYATSTNRKWDVVSIDCPTNMFDECAALLPLWGLLARKVIILGCGPDTELRAPEGWYMTDKVWRSRFNGGVYWAVFQSLTDPLVEGWKP